MPAATLLHHTRRLLLEEMRESRFLKEDIEELTLVPRRELLSTIHNELPSLRDAVSKLCHLHSYLPALDEAYFCGLGISRDTTVLPQIDVKLLKEEFAYQMPAEYRGLQGLSEDQALSWDTYDLWRASLGDEIAKQDRDKPVHAFRLDDMISSQLLLRNIAAVFGMPPPAETDGYKTAWEISLSFASGDLYIQDYKGGVDVKFHGTIGASARALALLNYIITMRPRKTCAPVDATLESPKTLEDHRGISALTIPPALNVAQGEWSSEDVAVLVSQYKTWWAKAQIWKTLSTSMPLLDREVFMCRDRIEPATEHDVEHPEMTQRGFLVEYEYCDFEDENSPDLETEETMCCWDTEQIAGSKGSASSEDVSAFKALYSNWDARMVGGSSLSLSSFISSHLLFYRLVVTLGMPPALTRDRPGFVWEVNVRNIHDNRSRIRFSGDYERPRMVFMGPMVRKQRALELLSHLTSMQCYTYDGVVAGSVA